MNKETKMDRIFNIFRKLWRRSVKLLKRPESGSAEVVLEVLLKFMSLWLKRSKEFRRNIDDFDGQYQFRSVDNSVAVAAQFKDKGLKVKVGLIEEADVSVIFKNGKSLVTLGRFLLSTDRDFIKLMLNNGVELKGNLNYMLKFSHMANHLLLPLNYLLVPPHWLQVRLKHLLLLRTLMIHILEREKDIIKLMFDKGIELKGNLSFMLKYNHMANHLLLRLKNPLL